jgi:hypothetical protein
VVMLKMVGVRDPGRYYLAADRLGGKDRTKAPDPHVIPSCCSISSPVSIQQHNTLSQFR